MKHFYYEIADAAIGRTFQSGVPINSRYFVQHNMHSELSFEPMQLSNRVWDEDDGIVTYVKNRFSDPVNTEVDMKEFMWVKLSSIPL